MKLEDRLHVSEAARRAVRDLNSYTGDDDVIDSKAREMASRVLGHFAERILMDPEELRLVDDQ